MGGNIIIKTLQDEIALYHDVHCSASSICLPARLRLHVLGQAVGLLLLATAAEEGHELEHDVDGILGRDVEECGGLVAERGAAAGEVGEGADGDEGDAVLVRHERDGGALHLHGGALEVSTDELSVAGIISVDVGEKFLGSSRCRSVGFFSSIRDKQVVHPRERTRGRERDVERQTIGGLDQRRKP